MKIPAVGPGAFRMICAVAGVILASSWPVATFTAEMSAEEKIEVFATLPDWSGIWMGTGTLFDQSRGQRSPNDPATRPRNHPPFNPDWEARYQRFLENVVWQGTYVDPLTFGYVAGMPRMMAPSRGLQFVVRPEQVWVIHERPDVRYIYTDGRDHPPEELRLPTMEGHSIGHWEGDTLVIETIGLKGGVPVDRTGMVLSGEHRIVERIRKIDDTTIENVITIFDPVAFTEPWVVTRRYNKLEIPDAYMANVNSLENNRNPVENGETLMLLGEEGFEFDPDAVYPPDLAARAAM
ncbi:MAG TPA: hypothetical protein VIV14_07820 [Gammaproteobacteria bacterium]